MIKKTFFILVAVIFSTNAIATPPKNHTYLVGVDVYEVPKPADKQVILTYPARLKAKRNVDIVARVSGTLIKKYYKEGEFVKKNQLLYKIEPDTYQAQYNEALANVKIAQAQLYKAERDWKRYKKLFKEKAISQQKLDYVYASYQNALASLKLAKAKLKLAQINLNYTDVKAPISGFTSLKLVDVGDYVNVGTKLLRITQTNPIYAEFSFSDNDFLRIKQQLFSGRLTEKPKIIAYIKQNGHIFKGYVDFIDSKIDPKTQTVKARAIFENKKGELMPNQFARIKVAGFIQKHVIWIPATAVLQNSMGKMVFIVKNGRIGVRMIKAKESTNNTFIVQYGLKPKDLVVIDNFFKIRPGMAVKIDKIIKSKAQ
ncbi:efflux RND transporter periplasmic adaptor subunit [Hippea maritima]|uniref:Efflux transporter, RND family, MFP subunit n=1 Tax=Hippea maritima (strain ATCC 700847 / DSM 10411 / MH2) TaxID=760142 RepID=F2LY59_HIPMA|nr:efflux RND transporter periplasmic adaptor subunit [Hippea maritima]AEA34382.1 efflux transporter, RND family, MFP subunit [Hippea maritima DSM 10411]